MRLIIKETKPYKKGESKVELGFSKKESCKEVEGQFSFTDASTKVVTVTGEPPSENDMILVNHGGVEYIWNTDKEYLLNEDGENWKTMKYTKDGFEDVTIIETVDKEKNNESH